MTDQLRKAALDFLRAAVEAPGEGDGYYAIDSGGEIYWYKDKPRKGTMNDHWMPEDDVPHKRQRIAHWNSLLFSAEELASTPVEPPQSAPAPSPKMGPFDMERFKAGELAYREGSSINDRAASYRYLGALADCNTIACARVWAGSSCENLVGLTSEQLEGQTKMPVKTKKVYIELWLDNSGHFFALCKDQSDEKVGHIFRSGSFEKTLIEIIEREVEV